MIRSSEDTNKRGVEVLALFKGGDRKYSLRPALISLMRQKV
jgi:hypothetical protein